ncbi:MAG: shikimate dehydrogenase [Candidatus Solibacter usitatus]|nr:shikimate dehydrogenase [Candidatus Solibacter usitatus]
MHFIGVTTAQSAMMRIFPLWMRELGRPDVELRGVDLPLNAEPDDYRRVVDEIKGGEGILGALITTHKIRLLEAARDRFQRLDSYATTCNEISCISKREGLLLGHAKDPISCGKSLDGMLSTAPPEVVCLGAGGAAIALAAHLREREDRPEVIHIVDRNPMRMSAVEALGARFHCHQEAERNDELVGEAQPGSLIVNATGMGKDLPGSPLTNAVLFPERACVWELNYRGERKFLHQALAQQTSRDLSVHDGWMCFLYGWTEVIAEVLRQPIDAALFARLRKLAESVQNA